MSEQATITVRRRECMECKHEWESPVVYGKPTTNISGEAKEYCPKCGSRGVVSYPHETRQV